MNLSGVSVRELVEKNEAEPETDLIVIQDELDFVLGTLKLQTRRGAAGHNGIESIIGALGTTTFWRIRWSGARATKSLATGKVTCCHRFVRLSWRL